MKRKFDDITEVTINKRGKNDIESSSSLDLFSAFPPEMILYIYDFLDDQSLSTARTLCKFSKVISDTAIKDRNIRDIVQTISNLFSLVLFDHFCGKFYFYTSKKEPHAEGEAKFILNQIFSLNFSAYFYRELGEKVAIKIVDKLECYTAAKLTKLSERIRLVFNSYQLVNYNNIVHYVDSLFSVLKKLLDLDSRNAKFLLNLCNQAKDLYIQRDGKNTQLDESVCIHDYKSLCEFLSETTQYYLAWCCITENSNQLNYLVYRCNSGKWGINGILSCFAPYKNNILPDILTSLTIKANILRNFTISLNIYDEIAQNLVFNLIDIYEAEDDKIRKKNILNIIKFSLDTDIVKLYHESLRSDDNSWTVFEYSIIFDVELTKLMIKKFINDQFFNNQLRTYYLSYLGRIFVVEYCDNLKLKDESMKINFLNNFKKYLEVVKPVFSFSEIQENILSSALESEKKEIDFDYIFGQEYEDRPKPLLM